MTRVYRLLNIALLVLALITMFTTGVWYGMTWEDRIAPRGVMDHSAVECSPGWEWEG